LRNLAYRSLSYIISLFFVFKGLFVDIFVGIFVLGKLLYLNTALTKGRHDQIMLYQYPQFSTNSRLAVTGGATKLSYLYAFYSSSEVNFNILYLVSSSLPKGYLALIAYALLYRIPIILNQNGTAYSSWSGYCTTLFNLRIAIPALFSDYIIFQSIFCRQAFLSHLPCSSTLKLKPFSILYNPISIQGNKLAFPLCNEQSTYTLVVAGSHHDNIRIVRAIEVLSLLSIQDSGPLFKLLIAGRIFFDLVQFIDFYYPELKNSISIFGPYTSNDLGTIYSPNSILLHLKPYDPCPTVPLEAMSYGVPVIASKSGGLPELVGSDSGVLIDSGFSDLYAVPPLYIDTCFPEITEVYPAASDILSAIRKISTCYSLYSAGAYHNSKKFDSSLWLSQHHSIFHNLLSGQYS